MLSTSKYLAWMIWLLITIGLIAFFSFQLKGEDKRIFLPGETSSGHYQIELQCDACHGDSFSGPEEMQKKCVGCHSKELKEADDSHPKSKFTDPRNADRVKILDARYCVTCHAEHKPEITSTMGVTLPEGFCIKCHEEIEQDRPSHKGMEFDTCASAGCHNFHDNRALYEDFLLKHVNEPAIDPHAAIPATNYGSIYREQKENIAALTLADIDAPAEYASDNKILHDWSSTAHASAGVNCSGCHQEKNKADWIEKPGPDQCKSCHSRELQGFKEGKHGMRLKADLPPMQPKLGRLPLRKTASEKDLGCNSCHRAHEYNTRHAAVNACLTCHNDEHSIAYKKSPHFQLWLKETVGGSTSGSGVSCATCHLPREEYQGLSSTQIFTQHNQNKNLRPNEKMIRGVCLNCHSLELSIDALADPDLVRRNFTGRPKRHIESIDMAAARDEKPDR